MAQFGAEVNYWWQPILPGSTLPNGPASLLGQLEYSYSTSASSFATLVPSIVASRPLAATPLGLGILEITGNAFVAGDPYTISVQSVPEPSSAAIMGIGIAGLGWFASDGVRSRLLKWSIAAVNPWVHLPQSDFVIGAQDGSKRSCVAK